MLELAGCKLPQISHFLHWSSTLTHHLKPILYRVYTCVHNQNLANIRVALTWKIMIRAGHILHISRQLSCRDIRKVVTWLTIKKLRANGISTRIQWGAHKTFVEGFSGVKLFHEILCSIEHRMHIDWRSPAFSPWPQWPCSWLFYWYPTKSV